MLRRTTIAALAAGLLLLPSAPAAAVTLDDPDLGLDPAPLVVEDVPDGWLDDDGVWRAPLTDEELAAIPENVEPEEATEDPTPAEDTTDYCVLDSDGWSSCDDGSTWAPDAPGDATGSIG